MSSQREITSLSSYLNLLEELNIKYPETEMLFRGQSQDFPLIPKLGRLNFKDSMKDTESKMVEEFKRTSLSLTEIRPEDHWDVLALAQHHGLPTRLLDWSFSPLVAIWFAVENIPKNNNYGVVWCMAPQKNDFRDTNYFADPLDNKDTKIFVPRSISKRITSQSGAFTAHRIVAGEKIHPLDTVKGFRDRLLKITIPAPSFSIIRKSLNQMGIHHGSIYPDIDGLCKHIERKYSLLG